MGKFSNVDVVDIRTSLKATNSILEKIVTSSETVYNDLSGNDFKNSTPVTVSSKILKGVATNDYKGSIYNAKKLIVQIDKSLDYIKKYQEAEKKFKEYEKKVKSDGEDASALDKIRLKSAQNDMEKYERLIEKQLKRTYTFKECTTSGKNGSRISGVSGGGGGAMSGASLYNSPMHDSYMGVLSHVKSTIKNAASKAKNEIKYFLDYILKRTNPTIDTYWSDGGGSTSGGGIYDKPQFEVPNLVITKGASVNIPGSLKQTGIISDYTQNYGTRGWDYDQKTLRDAWKNAGSKTDGNLCIYNGRYLVAVGDGLYGNIGDEIDIVLNDGTTIPAIIADQKRVEGSSIIDSNSGHYGHIYGNQESLIEFEASNTSQVEVTDGLKVNGWYGKDVKTITNLNHNVITNSNSTAIDGIVKNPNLDSNEVQLVSQVDGNTIKSAATSATVTNVKISESQTANKTSSTIYPQGTGYQDMVAIIKQFEEIKDSNESVSCVASQVSNVDAKTTTVDTNNGNNSTSVKAASSVKTSDVQTSKPQSNSSNTSAIFDDTTNSKVTNVSDKKVEETKTTTGSIAGATAGVAAVVAETKTVEKNNGSSGNIDFKSINYTRSGSKDTITSNGSTQAKIMYNTLKAEGLNDAQIAGVMGNAFVESGFNNTSKVMDVNGYYAHGCFQNNESGKYSDFVKYCNKNGYSTSSTEAQTKYVVSIMDNNSAFMSIPNTADGAAQAADLVRSKYEVTGWAKNDRINNAVAIFNEIN